MAIGIAFPFLTTKFLERGDAWRVANIATWLLCKPGFYKICMKEKGDVTAPATAEHDLHNIFNRTGSGDSDNIL